MQSRRLFQAFFFASVLGLPCFGSPTPGIGLGSAAASEADLPGHPVSYVVSRTAILYEQPSSDSRILRMIRPGTIVHVVETRGDWYRIQSARADRPSGYIRRSLANVAPAAPSSAVAFRPGVFRVTRATKVRAAPSSRARTITTLSGGAEVQVVGESGSWYRIQSETGGRPPGYVVASAVRRVRNLD